MDKEEAAMTSDECCQCSEGIQCLHHSMYEQGRLKPNYPVPALREEVNILPNAVFVYREDGNTEYITYLTRSGAISIWE